MFSDRIANGMRVGALGGAATAGAVIGLGYRHQYATPPFAIFGREAALRLGIPLTADPVAMVAGAVIHVTLLLLWGICFALFAGRLRGLALLAAAVIFSAFVGALSATVLPAAMGVGAMATLTVPQTVFYLVVLALSLAAGMRLARVAHGDTLASGDPRASI